MLTPGLPMRRECSDSQLGRLRNYENGELQCLTADNYPPVEGTISIPAYNGGGISALPNGGAMPTSQTALNVYTQPNHHVSSLALNQDNQLLPRRPSFLLQEILSTRRPSFIMAALRPANNNHHRPRHLGSLHEDMSVSTRSVNGPYPTPAQDFRRKNRRIGDDALSSSLSALYAKLIVIMGVALPVTEILSSKIPTEVYHGFYIYLYLGSICFVVFAYLSHMKTRAVFSLIKNYHEKNNQYHMKTRMPHFGSFYLRVGAIAFGIGAMVYSGLEIGQVFELNGTPGCTNILLAITPAARMLLSIIQIKFIFLNTTELDMAKHKVISRFGLMHMVATNLCEWLYVLVEETKHEIFHLAHVHHPVASHVKSVTLEATTNILTTITTALPTDDSSSMEDSNEMIFNATDFIARNLAKRSMSDEHVDCHRTNIMGTLVQNASPFLFPCTIEYSLICAVILFEMWKKVKSLPDIERSRRNSEKHQQKSAHHFSVDCSRAHRGMFAGILVIVLTIISLIMYFVLYNEPNYEDVAITQVTVCEILLYVVTTVAVITAVIKMRDLKYQQKHNDHHASSVSLDCTLLVLAQTGVYVYGMFSMMGCYYTMQSGGHGGKEGLAAEVFGLIQTSVQTLFILNACWRKCKGAQQQRSKPGREIVTFLLVANMSMWFINTLIKGRAGFRPSHLTFFGMWAWTVITHVSMPLAIFYRFHSTICLFDIWKSAYKGPKQDH